MDALDAPGGGQDTGGRHGQTVQGTEPGGWTGWLVRSASAANDAIMLLSSPLTPEYNGSCEAGRGSSAGRRLLRMRSGLSAVSSTVVLAKAIG